MTLEEQKGRGAKGQRGRRVFLPNAQRLMPKKLSLVVAVLIWVSITVFTSAPATAQIPGYQDVWQQIYQQLPDLPLENQYINKETGKVDPNNTLISRLIRYHLFVKGRPPNYRLDWKLTLADYLDANELMSEGSYPGYDSLRKNPMEGDRAAIQRLTRQQRNALVQALVNVFSPNPTAESQPESRPTPASNNPTVKPETPNSRSVPSQAQPGGADLLRL